MNRTALRRILELFRATPLHPQWLLGRRHDIAAKIRSLPAGRVLDIGCNDRWVERHLAPQSAYLGIDFFSTGKHIYGSQPDVFADACQLPFVDSAVHAIVMLEVLEHLRFPQAAFQELARVLRPQGMLLMTVPFLYPVHDAPHDYQRYTSHGLSRELEAIGFKIEEIVPSMGAIESAGLLASLTLAGVSDQAIARRSASCLLVPLLAMAIPVINVMAWAAGKLLPSWSAMTAGYRISASKA